jgi:hypothetical protein
MPVATTRLARSTKLMKWYIQHLKALQKHCARRCALIKHQGALHETQTPDANSFSDLASLLELSTLTGSDAGEEDAKLGGWLMAFGFVAAAEIMSGKARPWAFVDLMLFLFPVPML